MGTEGMSDVRWEGFTHEEIYARVQQGPGRAASADAEAAWSTVETTIRDVDEQLTRAVKQVGAGWQGAAADNVDGGMRAMSNWALDAAGDAQLTKNGIAAQAEQAGFVRAAMPPPRTAEWNDAVGRAMTEAGFVPGFADVGALEEQMANDRARAVEIMNHYSTRSSENQQMMNYWTQPPTVVVETVASAPASGLAGAASVSPVAFGFRRPTPSDASSATVPPAAGAILGPGGSAPSGDGVGAPPTAGGAIGAGLDTRPGTSAAGNAGTVPTAPDASSSASTSTSGPGVLPAVPAGGAAPSRAGRPPGTATFPRGTGAPSDSSSAGERAPYSAASVGVRPVVPGPPSRPGAGGPGFRDAPLDRVAVPRSPLGAVEPLPRPNVGSFPTEPIPRPHAGVPSEGTHPGRGVAEPIPTAERAVSRSATPAGHGILPMGGPGRPAGQEHRRPDYLIDDTDAFADDRRFTPPVIGGDDIEGSHD
jgi:hypothetical protein